MKIKKRGVQLAAIAAATSLVLAACGGDDADPAADEPDTEEPDDEDDDDDDVDEEMADVTVIYAAEQEYASYNNSTADQNAFRNSLVHNLVRPGFWRYDPSGEAVPNEEFGSYDVVSEDPLIVEFNISPEATWSDGTPIDCADFMLGYVANAGHLTVVAEEDDEDLGIEAGAETNLFSTAGTTGYEDWVKPSCEPGDKNITVEYETVNATWVLYTAIDLPAHVVYEQGGLTEEEFLQAIQDDDADALAAAAEFYNKGWVMNPGDLLDESLIPSHGQYTLESWDAGQSLTLTANENYWGAPPASSTIIFRFMDQDEQVPALGNREVDVIDPQPNLDLVQQIEGMDGVVVDLGESFTYEHLDFDMGPGGLFEDNFELQQAFALCVPRQLIVDNLIKPQNPDAEVLQARLTYSFQPDYNEQIEGSGYEEYAEQDIEASAAILEDLDAVGTEVRIGYQTPNPRRTDQVALIRDHCNEAGFDIVDHGQDDFFGVGLDEGNWDVALFAWVGSAYVSGTASTFRPAPCEAGQKGNNNGCYVSEDVDALYAELLSEVDFDAQRELVKQIETILWADLPTIPLFTFPSLAAWTEDTTGIVNNQSQGGITWNGFEWSKAF